jgi:myo-inositol-1(or 4)-monophosphatase
MTDRDGPAGGRFLDRSTVDELTAAFVAISDGALEWFGAPLEIGNKAPHGFDPVTVADRTLEERFREAILERFPDHSIVGEEAARHEGTADVEWIIDPIDGTRAFVTGRPMWGSLVGVSVSGVPIAGWMHQPVLGLTHVGCAGQTMVTTAGSTTVVQTRSVTRLEDAVLMCTHPGMFRTREERWAFAAVERAVQQSRYDGDCANYGFLASGFGDLVIENQLQPYDIVPLIPIIEGAGGIVTDVDGGSPSSGGWIVAAANAELHRAALAALAQGRSDATTAP